MKIPRDMSGGEMVKILCRNWGYGVVNRVGSHVVLQTETPGHHRIVVPDHSVLKIGTLHGILRAVAVHKCVPREAVFSERENTASATPNKVKQ